MPTFSHAAGYAFRALSYLDGPEGDYRPAKDLADLSGTPGPYLAKQLHELHKARILESVRGRKGGIRLAREAASITLGAVVDALDGPGWRASCLLGLGGCQGSPTCLARACCLGVRDVVVHELDRLTIQDLAVIRAGRS